MALVALRGSKLAAGLCFPRSHPRKAMRHLPLMTQGDVDVVPYEPFAVCVSTFQDKSVCLPKHYALFTALQSPAPIMTVCPASLRVAEVKERGESESGVTSVTDNAKT